MQLDVHVDGSSQGKVVVRASGPTMRQVEDSECKFTGVSWEGTSDGEIGQQASWEGTGDGEIGQQADSLLPVNQL